MPKENKKPSVDRPNLDPSDKTQESDNEERYGMGGGLIGTTSGNKQIKADLGDYTKKTKSLGLEKPVETGQGAVADITARIKRRPLASDAPGAIVPYARRDEALISILAQYGDSLAEAPQSVIDLCASLLVDVEDKNKFDALRNHFESMSIEMPTWTEAVEEHKRLDEYYAGFLGIGGGNMMDYRYPWDRPGNFTPGMQERVVKGFSFHIPKPPRFANLARKRAGKENAKAFGADGEGLHSRMARARWVYNTTHKDTRMAADKKHGDNMRGSHGRGFRGAKGADSQIGETMLRAGGKYDDISESKITFSEGLPTLKDGSPWFHGSTRRDVVGGVPVIIISEGMLICSGSLPRPKLAEGYQVWSCGCPLANFDMEIAFSHLTEGMETVRPWMKRKGDTTVYGLPTEGVIVKKVNEDLSFMTFDSQSGYETLQEWMIDCYQTSDARKAIEEAVTYGYVRAGAADYILDRVIRKLNRLNVLDTFKDAMFDNQSQSLYVIMDPELSESDIQQVAMGLQQEYPETQIIGGPKDESIDWWVMYIPKPGSNSSPQLDNLFEPRINKPLDVEMPDILTKAIKHVAAHL